jgi:hypothetical protein
VNANDLIRLHLEGKVYDFDLFAPAERLARQASGFGYQEVGRQQSKGRRAIVMKHSPEAHKLVIVHDRPTRQTLAIHNDTFDPAGVAPQRVQSGELHGFLRGIHGSPRKRGRGGVL